jgi:formamidopyrimidine-DNA glycosylase
LKNIQSVGLLFLLINGKLKEKGMIRMPELPEMENYSKLLNQRIAGQVITDVQINREKSINVNPDLFIAAVRGQQVLGVERRAKHLLFHLQNGHVLLLHLMLGGWMFYGTEEEKPKRTIQIRLSFGQNHLYFIGLRLGYLHLYSEKGAVEQLAHLGPEPLPNDFTLDQFSNMLSSKHGKLKASLLDQDFIAGIGNCYSDEICFHAGVKPIREISDLEASEIGLLFKSMKSVLTDALNHGGYIRTPFFQGDTLTGGYDELCQVYDRGGEDCLRCGAVIIQDKIASRKTFYCPNCQK